MFIHYYPLWKLSLWYNLSFDHNQLDAMLLELYQKTISSKLNEMRNEDEQLEFVTKIDVLLLGKYHQFMIFSMMVNFMICQ